jgi:hypothetical protein
MITFPQRLPNGSPNPRLKLTITTLFALMVCGNLLAHVTNARSEPTSLIKSIQRFLVDWLILRDEERVIGTFHKKANTDKFTFSDTLDCLERGMPIESRQTSGALQKNLGVSLLDFSRRL